MASYDDPATASLRLSNADRDAAVAALAQALADGRITSDEFTERSATARTAVTRGELAPLFTDLPDSVHGAPASRQAAPPTAEFAPSPQAPVADGPYSGMARRRPLGGSAGVIAVSISPFVALGLFFLCGYLIPDGFRWSWIFFGLIPVAGIVVYGAGGRGGYDRDR